jgi:hypothetical protein
VTEVGEGATVGHLCVVHGALIGTEAVVGNDATVLDGGVVGPRALAAGVPARILGEISGGARRWVAADPEIHRALPRRHAAGARPVTGPHHRP